MPESTTRAKLFVKNSAAIFIALVISGILGIGLRMFFSRTLSMEEYGLIFWTINFVTFFSVFRDLGLNTALTRFVTIFATKKELRKIKASMNGVILIQILSTTPIALVLFLFSDQISLATVGSLEASVFIKIFSIWFFLLIFFNAFRSTIRGLQDTTIYASMEVNYVFIILLSAFFLVQFFAFGKIGAGLAYLMGAGLSSLLYILAFCYKYEKVFKEKAGLEKALLKKMWKFAFPLFLASFGGIIISCANTLLLGILSTTAEVALYESALPLASIISMFFTAVIAVFYPLASELWVKKNKKLLSFAIFHVVKFSFMFTVPLSFIFLVFPDIALGSIFTPQYSIGSSALQVLSATAVIGGILNIFTKCVIPATGKTVIVPKITIVMGAINILTNIILVPYYGATGSAVAFLASTLFGVLFSVFFLRGIIKLLIPVQSLVRIFASGACMLGLTYFVKSIIFLEPWWLEAGIVVMLSALCYLLLLFISGAVNKRDINLLKEVLPLPGKLVKIVQRIARD